MGDHSPSNDEPDEESNSPGHEAAAKPNLSAKKPRPRVEVIWAMQELERLDQLILEAEDELGAHRSQRTEDSETAEEATVRSSLERLIKKRYGIYRWVVRHTDEKPGGGRKPTKGKKRAQAANSSRPENSAAKKSVNGSANPTQQNKAAKTSKSKDSKANNKSTAWTVPSTGQRKRARFVR
ncbi:hypothetical protein BXY47_2607 [Dietzia kunjamensis]|uniref:hypothetical protein n=1 Tax=Dietzia kunjamensis TaxID=322509 RepID=UPI000FF54EF2|nr:hypothetical protein [Dietzia kunjamensis]MBB1012347.1 hypothetical protein [Dietzia kunjamensis]RKE59522.1 hypothetical protein BXY47_2607 [Dietzia kunjamensis]